MVCALASLVVGLPAVALVYVRRGTASTQSGASHPHAVRVLKCTAEDGAATFKLPRGVATADIDWQSCRQADITAWGRRLMEQENLGI